jgi:hypothetical protein
MVDGVPTGDQPREEPKEPQEPAEPPEFAESAEPAKSAGPVDERSGDRADEVLEGELEEPEDRNAH